MQIAEKFRALTLLEKVDFMIAVARNIGVSRETIYQLKRLAVLLTLGMVGIRKSSVGAPKKVLARNGYVFKAWTNVVSVYNCPLKNKHPDPFHSVSTRTIRH